MYKDCNLHCSTGNITTVHCPCLNPDQIHSNKDTQRRALYENGSQDKFFNVKVSSIKLLCELSPYLECYHVSAVQSGIATHLECYHVSAVQSGIATHLECYYVSAVQSGIATHLECYHASAVQSGIATHLECYHASAVQSGRALSPGTS